MSNEKVEGGKQDCGACGTKLICVEIEEEWQGKVTKKLQWQNELDHKPHFRYVSPGKYKCVKPEEKSDDYLKNKQEEITKGHCSHPDDAVFLKEDKNCSTGFICEKCQKPVDVGTVSRIKKTKAEELLKQTKKTEFTVENLVTIDKEINKLIVIEKIITKKLTTGDLPPNPAKVGMYMKFIYDKMNVEQ